LLYLNSAVTQLEQGIFMAEYLGAWSEVTKRILQAAIYEQLRLELGADVALMDLLIQHEETTPTQKLPIQVTPDARTSIVLSPASRPYYIRLADLHERETVEVHGAC
jgi:hypothetical protein